LFSPKPPKSFKVQGHTRIPDRVKFKDRSTRDQGEETIARGTRNKLGTRRNKVACIIEAKLKLKARLSLFRASPCPRGWCVGVGRSKYVGENKGGRENSIAFEVEHWEERIDKHGP
jgi:hypothetical protein